MGSGSRNNDGVLSACLNDFQQQHPDIHLQISNGDNEAEFHNTWQWSSVQIMPGSSLFRWV